MSGISEEKKIKKNSYMQLFGGKEADTLFERPDDSISWELLLKTYHKSEKEFKDQIKTHRKLVKGFIKGNSRRMEVEKGFHSLQISQKQI
jgi:hypothetical protein